MKFVIRNQAGISKKYIRFAKWKIRKLSSKFSNLASSDVFIKQISSMPPVYATTVRLGVPGSDIIVSAESMNLNQLWSELSSKMKRQLRKNSAKRKFK